MIKVKILRVQECFGNPLPLFVWLCGLCYLWGPEVRTLDLSLKCEQFSFTDRPGSGIHLPLHPLVLGFQTGDTRSVALYVS